MKWLVAILLADMAFRWIKYGWAEVKPIAQWFAVKILRLEYKDPIE